MLLVLALGTTAAMATPPAPADPSVQEAGQSNSSDQSATSNATSTQSGATNTNIPVRVLSPGNDGSVSQSNSSTAGSIAANLNATSQSTGQQQAGAGGAGVQAAGQDNASSQSAESTAGSTQDRPANYNIPVRVLSPGHDGDVEQSNSSTAVSVGANANLTEQDIHQKQAGGGGAPNVQAAGQQNASTQHASSGATSTQTGAANYNIPVRVLSPGNGGTVSQSNDSTALSAAVNLNKTGQGIGQHQVGLGHSYAPLVQAAGQAASSSQSAGSTATSTQSDATNTNIPVRVLSPGNDGSVSQSNSSFAGSLALNANLLCQSIRQQQGGLMLRR
jgi:hypothetical protein